jgi:hypothetical protein
MTPKKVTVVKGWNLSSRINLKIQDKFKVVAAMDPQDIEEDLEAVVHLQTVNNVALEVLETCSKVNKVNKASKGHKDSNNKVILVETTKAKLYISDQNLKY